jgi:hypothetical protein
MKALKNKTSKAMRAVNDIKESQSTRLFFESLPVENQRDLFKAIDQLKVFFDNIPEKKQK